MVNSLEFYAENHVIESKYRPRNYVKGYVASLEKEQIRVNITKSPRNWLQWATKKYSLEHPVGTLAERYQAAWFLQIFTTPFAHPNWGRI